MSSAHAEHADSEPGSTTDTGLVAATVPSTRPHVVIVGAGFCGLAAARVLARHPGTVRVTVVDQRNHHTFTPFLYQVATGQLAPPAAAHPVRALLRKMANVEFRLATVTGVNVTRHRVETDRGSIRYDYLILAAGAVNDYARSPGIAARCLALADLGEAQALRNQLLGCFEAAAGTTDHRQRARLLTFAIVGGGPTGAEFAVALATLVRQLTQGDFRGVAVRVMLVESAPIPLGSFPAGLADAAAKRLRAAGAEVITGTTVIGADDDGITLSDGRHVDAATVIWAAGVRANPLAGTMPATGSRGRVIVGPALQVERHPDVFVAGDMAQASGQAGPLPMDAAVAIATGRHAARSILRLRAGRRVGRFRCHVTGVAVTPSDGHGTARPARLRLAGAEGWLGWLVIRVGRGAGPRAAARLVLSFTSGYPQAHRPGQLITGPCHADRGTDDHAAGPEPATARMPAPVARADLPSVNVANANRWGRIAALAWWGQAYPGLREEQEKPRGLRALRERKEKLRHELTGDKSQTRDNYRG